MTRTEKAAGSRAAEPEGLIDVTLGQQADPSISKPPPI
jgi:hypothetical protein